MPSPGELDLVPLFAVVSCGAVLLRETTRHWQARRVRRQTGLWVETIRRAVTEEDLRNLVVPPVGDGEG